jgi:hypothetical protein
MRPAVGNTRSIRSDRGATRTGALTPLPSHAGAPGHSGGALTRDQAERLIEDFSQLDDRYRNLITQLRRLLNDLENDDAPTRNS